MVFAMLFVDFARQSIMLLEQVNQAGSSLVNQPYFSCAHISQSAHARDEWAGKIRCQGPRTGTECCGQNKLTSRMYSTYFERSAVITAMATTPRRVSVSKDAC